MAGRYCTACGNELSEGSGFCSNCGQPVHQMAQTGTPQANVQMPPPPYQQQQASAYPQQTGGSVGGARGPRAGYYWIAFAVLAILALVAGDTGQGVGLIGLIIAAVWVYRDAASRGMQGAAAWAAGVFLLFIVFFPLYFVRRRPRM